jgi:hypothetical protein
MQIAIAQSYWRIVQWITDGVPIPVGEYDLSIHRLQWLYHEDEFVVIIIIIIIIHHNDDIDDIEWWTIDHLYVVCTLIWFGLYRSHETDE